MLSAFRHEAEKCEPLQWLIGNAGGVEYVIARSEASVTAASSGREEMEAMAKASWRRAHCCLRSTSDERRRRRSRLRSKARDCVSDCAGCVSRPEHAGRVPCFCIRPAPDRYTSKARLWAGLPRCAAAGLGIIPTAALEATSASCCRSTPTCIVVDDASTTPAVLAPLTVKAIRGRLAAWQPEIDVGREIFCTIRHRVHSGAVGRRRITGSVYYRYPATGRDRREPKNLQGFHGVTPPGHASGPSTQLGAVASGR